MSVAVMPLTGVALETSSSSTSSQFTVASGPVLLILAWVFVMILIVVGVSTGRPRLTWSGVISVGVMTVVTPLAYYVSEAVRLGVFRASVLDFLLLAGVSATGGGIIAFGVSKLISHRTPTQTIATDR